MELTKVFVSVHYRSTFSYSLTGNGSSLTLFSASSSACCSATANQTDTLQIDLADDHWYKLLMEKSTGGNERGKKWDINFLLHIYTQADRWRDKMDGEADLWTDV